MKLNAYYLKKIASWLLPYHCILCSQPADRSQDLCLSCFKTMPRAKYACHRCARPLMDGSQIQCNLCLEHGTPFDSTHALFLYEPPVTKLIMNLKFGEALVNARILGELLAEQIQTNWYQNKSLPEVIIPIPLHAQRLKERGFNQSLEIAKSTANRLGLPLEYRKCQRIRHTRAQATLPAIQRQENMKNAFIVKKNLPYRRVAVIDDVITTGHTITEFCKILKNSGIKSIDVWCCARPKPTPFDK